MQMESLATADGFHSWLQDRCADGSWAREGALHLRITDFQTPAKALEFLQVGLCWSMYL